MKKINIFIVIVAIVFCLITILIKQNNNNNYQKSECNLPCIWGLTPGETNLLDLELILNNQENIQISEYIELDNNYIHLEVNNIDTGTKAVIQVKNEIIEKIIITDGDNKLLDNKIDEFLIRNGSPNSILIEIASQQFNQWDVTLSLIYSEKHFLATYNTHDYNIINNHNAIICFNQNPGLIVKNINENITIYDNYPNLNDFSIDEQNEILKDITDVSDLNLDQIISRFINDENQCIQIKTAFE